MPAPHRNTATTRRIVTQKAEDLHRLADQDERKGIKILLAELGRLPEETPEVAPAPEAVAVCLACGGHGIDPRCHGHQVAGGVVTCPCDRCQGAGTAAPAIREQPARLAV